MATKAFYDLNKRKIKNFYNNLQELLANKSTNDITIEDVLKYTGVSRTTFYNYFKSIYELYSDFIEYRLRDLTEVSKSLIVENKNSIFAVAVDIYKKGKEFLDNDYIIKVATNFLQSNNRIIRTVYSKQMENYIQEVLEYFIAETIEGKKINNISKLYTLFNTIVCYLLVAFESYVYSKTDNSHAVCLFDFDYMLNMTKCGYEKIYL